MLLLGTMFGVLVTSPLHVSARPAYAQKEGKACQYCHISASPGLISVDPNTKLRTTEPFTRNARGIYYFEHNHTFDGYVERKVMGASAPPVFHFGWRETLADLPRRVAVADVVGDGKPRLITLNEKVNDKLTSVLTVKHWDGKEFVAEFTTETHGPADRLAVGKFAGANRPAVILTSDALWLWSGKGYAHVPATRPLALFGIARMHDGSERVLVANSPSDIKAYTVDAKSGDGEWLKDGIAPPNSGQVTWCDMHATPDFFDKIGMPTILQPGRCDRGLGCAQVRQDVPLSRADQPGFRREERRCGNQQTGVRLEEPELVRGVRRSVGYEPGRQQAIRPCRPLFHPRAGRHRLRHRNRERQRRRHARPADPHRRHRRWQRPQPLLLPARLIPLSCR